MLDNEELSMSKTDSAPRSLKSNEDRHCSKITDSNSVFISGIKSFVDTERFHPDPASRKVLLFQLLCAVGREPQNKTGPSLI